MGMHAAATVAVQHATDSSNTSMHTHVSSIKGRTHITTYMLLLVSWLDTGVIQTTKVLLLPIVFMFATNMYRAAKGLSCTQ